MHDAHLSDRLQHFFLAAVEALKELCPLVLVVSALLRDGLLAGLHLASILLQSLLKLSELLRVIFCN